MIGRCISYPKSGRTWLRFMLSELGADVDYSHMGTGASSAEWGLRFEELPLAADPGLPTLFLHRDPRDTTVSFWHERHSRQLPKRKPATLEAMAKAGMLPPKDLDAFVRSDRFGIEKLCRFNLWCAEHLTFARHFSYEALHQDTAGVLADILAFLGLRATAGDIVRVAESGSFARMRRMEEAEDIPPALRKRLGAVDRADPNSYKVRRGTIGNWEREMSAETAAWARGRMDALGYPQRFG